MAACRCGASIVWASVEGGASKVPLDAHGTYHGPGRYRVLEYHPTWLVEMVPTDAAVVAHGDHRLTCPALSAAERNQVWLALRGERDAQQLAGRGAPPP